ncbi:hypothetical protein L6452_02831 [Arctium lappa]|uniref:Uncharacterized protein n=1 Tax=Arctium lappa TaxID=4217 RepID=A0ACB9FKM7_ARCLA|nr:hypothetical protein L6452_02831 [Arctium lappa]
MMNQLMISDDDEDERFSNRSASVQDKVDPDSMHKAPGSFKSDIPSVHQNCNNSFLKSDMLSLENAAKILLGDARNPSLTRTKVRRLYDIANVLSSMNFMEVRRLYIVAAKVRRLYDIANVLSSMNFIEKVNYPL